MIKLTNGETLLGKIVQTDDGHLCVNDPVMLSYYPTKNGSASMTTLTWIPLVKQSNLVALKQEHIITHYDVTEELGLFYKKTVALLKNDPKEIEDVYNEIKQKQEELVESTEQEEHEKYLNKIKLIRSQAANTVH